MSSDYLSEKMKALILEIDGICNRHGMEYYLMGEALVTAVRGKPFPHRRKALSIAMHGKDFRKLSRIVKKAPNRALESLLNNPTFPGFYVRYVDLNTTMYDAGRKRQEYEHCCIGIEIYVLCPYTERTDIRGRCLEGLKQRWAYSVADSPTGFFGFLLQLCAKLGKLDKRFLSMMNRDDEASRLVEFYSAKGEHFILNRDSFGESKRCKVGDNAFNVPNAMKIVGRATNGGNLMFGKRNRENKIQKTHILSDSVPGKAYAEEVNRRKLNRATSIRKQARYLEWRDKIFTPMWDNRQKYYEYYFLTKERFDFYDVYCQAGKGKITELFAAGKYEKLLELLNPYIVRISVHEKAGFGLYFDREIFVIAILTRAYTVLKNEKVKVLARRNARRFLKIVDKIPQPYLKPLYAQREYTTEELEDIREALRIEIRQGIDELIKRK